MEEKKYEELDWNGRHWILQTEEGPIRFISVEEYEEWKSKPKKEESAPEEEE